MAPPESLRPKSLDKSTLNDGRMVLGLTSVSGVYGVFRRGSL